MVFVLHGVSEGFTWVSCSRFLAEFIQNSLLVWVDRCVPVEIGGLGFGLLGLMTDRPLLVFPLFWKKSMVVSLRQPLPVKSHAWASSSHFSRVKSTRSTTHVQ